MIRPIRNIIRLPNIYIPILLSVILVVFLDLLSGAVVASCIESKSGIKDVFKAEVTVAHKERKEKMTDEEGNIFIGDANTVRLDNDLISFLESYEGISEIKYFAPSVSLPMAAIISVHKYNELSEAVVSGEEVTLPIVLSYDMDMCYVNGSNDLPSALKYITEVNYADEIVILGEEKDFINGVILPKKIYKAFGEPKELVFGWYDNVMLNNIKLFEKNEAGDIVSSLYPADAAKKAEEMIIGRNIDSKPPMVSAKVIGYYTNINEGLEDYEIMAGINIWRSVDILHRYYGDTKAAEPSFDPDAASIDPIDLYGLTEIVCTLRDPSQANELMKAFSSAGYSPDDLIVTVTDYDYKFALAQIEGVQKLAECVNIAADALGIAVLIILILYGVKMRGREIYTLNTLGSKRGWIAFTISSEMAIVTVSAVALGIAASVLLGNTVCEAVNTAVAENVLSSAERLSETLNMMENKDEVISQLSSAIESFGGMGVRVVYSIDPERYVLLFFCALVLVLVTAVTVFIFSKKDLMKAREN